MEKDFTPIHNIIEGVLFSRYEFFQNSIRLLYGFFFEFTSKILKTIPAASSGLSFIEFLVSRSFEISIEKNHDGICKQKNLICHVFNMQESAKKSLYIQIYGAANIKAMTFVVRVLKM